MYVYLCLYVAIYISLCIYAPGAVSGGVEECTLNTRRHISMYVSVPAAVSGGYRSAHCTQASFLYIPTYIGIYRCIYIGAQWLPSAAVHMSAHCTQASFLCPLYMPIHIYRYIHCAQASFLPYTDI